MAVTIPFTSLALTICVLLSDVNGARLCRKKKDGFKFQCDDNYVIFKPDVKALNCRSNITGQTPDLIVQTNECHGERTCNVSFPIMPFVLPLNNIRGHGLFPERLSFVGGYCLKQDKVIIICNATTPMIHVDHDEFIVQSHTNFPWNYQQTDFFSEDEGKYLINICALTFNPKFTSYNKKLVISFLDFDLSNTTESLRITTGVKTIDMNTERKTIALDLGTGGKHSEVSKVTFSFINNITDSTMETIGGRGFVFCAKVMSPEEASNFNCSNLMGTKQNSTIKKLTCQSLKRGKSCNPKKRRKCKNKKNSSKSCKKRRKQKLKNNKRKTRKRKNRDKKKRKRQKSSSNRNR